MNLWYKRIHSENLIVKEKNVRRLTLLISLFIMNGLLVACSATTEKALIQPTEGKLTFAFFYTDG
jgi:hypothetical protein